MYIEMSRNTPNPEGVSGVLHCMRNVHVNIYMYTCAYVLGHGL
jgi:hypothetical protein